MAWRWWEEGERVHLRSGGKRRKWGRKCESDWVRKCMRLKDEVYHYDGVCTATTELVRS